MSISEESITGTPDNDSEYEEMISVLDQIISNGLYKFEGEGRIRDKDKEKVRIQYMKRTEQAIRAKRQVVKDRNLQRMGRTLERLQEENELDL
jgi:hypothetical protein